MNWYLAIMTKKYFEIKGRARRQEYWMFFLANFLIAIGIGFVSAVIKMPLLVSLYQLAVLIPGITVGIRRMHDTNHSGWFLLVPFYGLYLLLKEGDASPNPFGPDPKGEERNSNQHHHPQDYKAS